MREQQTLGRRIQEARKAAGLSQESLGERLGVSRQAVSKWEADAAVPELENLIAMSRIFGVTIGALLGVEPEAAEDRSEKDAPEAPGEGVEGTAPAGELTDRELAAVEAIVQKYLEAVRRPRWSRRRKFLAGAAVCAVLVLAAAGLCRHYSNLRGQIDEIQYQVGDIINILGEQHVSLSGLMREQRSIISDYSVQIQDYDLEKAVWYLTASVTPKEYTADTVATFTAQTNTGKTESAQARNDGGVFTVENWAVPMGEPVPPGVMDADDDESGSLVQVSVTLTDGDTSQIESLETLYEDPSAYQLWINGNWGEEWENSCLLFQELDLQISNETVGADRCRACALFQRRCRPGVVRAPHHRRGPVEPAGLCADARAHGAGGPSAAAPRRHPGSGRPHRRQPRPERLASVLLLAERQRHTVRLCFRT